MTADTPDPRPEREYGTLRDRCVHSPRCQTLREHDDRIARPVSPPSELTAARRVFDVFVSEGLIAPDLFDYAIQDNDIRQRLIDAARAAPQADAGLREAVGRYIVAVTRRASGGTTDREVQEAYEALYDAAAARVVPAGLDVETLQEAWGNVMDGRRIGVGLNAARVGRYTTTGEDWHAIAAEYDRLRADPR